MKTTIQHVIRLTALFSLFTTGALAQDAPRPAEPPSAEQSGSPDTQPTAEQKKAEEEKKKAAEKAQQLQEPDGIKQAEERLKKARKELAKALAAASSPEQVKRLNAAQKEVRAAEKSWARKLTEAARTERRRLVATAMLSILTLLLVGGAVWATGPKIRAMLGWKAKDKTTAEEEAYLRGALARSVMGYAFLFVTLIVVVVLGGGILNAVRKDVGKENATQFFEMSKYILGVLLPVVAAWVGTVMAFYFGRENFQAASKSVQEMARQATSRDKLDSQTVDRLGLDIGAAATYTLAAGVAPASVTLAMLATAFTKNGKTYERLPILNADGSPLCCLHARTLERYELKQLKAVPPGVALHLAGLLTAEPKLLTESYATLPRTCKGTDAQAMIGDFCKDVFITESGTNRSKVLYWITNLDLLNAAQV
jgi:hypothetical protein